MGGATRFKIQSFNGNRKNRISVVEAVNAKKTPGKIMLPALENKIKKRYSLPGGIRSLIAITHVPSSAYLFICKDDLIERFHKPQFLHPNETAKC